MADPRLQWKELRGPDFRDAILASRSAGDALNSAFESADSILGRYEAGKIRKNDFEVAQELAGIRTEEDYDQWLSAGGLRGRQVGADTLSLVSGGRKTVLGFANDRSITNDRDARLAIAEAVEGDRAREYQYGYDRRNELANMSGLIVDADLEGQQYGRQPGSTTGWGHIDYKNQGATRNKPISDQLAGATAFLGDMGITMQVHSGGQDGKGEGDRRTGSTRHDHGNAGDVEFYDKSGRKLTPKNPNDQLLLQEIFNNFAVNGITGVGYGDDYMGEGRFHIGYGSNAMWSSTKSGQPVDPWLASTWAKAQNYAAAGGASTAKTVGNGTGRNEGIYADTYRGGIGGSANAKLAAALGGSTFLSPQDIAGILDRSYGAMDIGQGFLNDEADARLKIDTALAQEANLDAANRIMADPDNVTIPEMFDAVDALGLPASETNAMRALIQEQVNNDPRNMPDPTQSEANNIVSEIIGQEIAAQNHAAQVDPQTQRINRIADFTENPAEALENALGGADFFKSNEAGAWGNFFGGGDGPYTRQKLDNLIHEYARKANVTPEIAAAAMYEAFNPDPTSLLGYNSNTLKNQFANSFLGGDKVLSLIEQDFTEEKLRDAREKKSTGRLTEARYKSIENQMGVLTSKRLKAAQKGEPTEKYDKAIAKLQEELKNALPNR